MVKGKIDRVLVATDGSEDAMEAARYAAALLRSLRPRITLLHVIPEPVIPPGDIEMRPRDLVEIEKAMLEGAQAILDRSRQPFDEAGLPVEGLIREGDAAEQILQVVREEEMDLVVVGSHGAGRAERAILGSTSDALVRAAPCPVLVVRRGTAD